jgi:hypothetical protein
MSYRSLKNLSNADLLDAWARCAPPTLPGGEPQYDRMTLTREQDSYIVAVRTELAARGLL